MFVNLRFRTILAIHWLEQLEHDLITLRAFRHHEVPTKSNFRKQNSPTQETYRRLRAMPEYVREREREDSLGIYFGSAKTSENSILNISKSRKIRTPEMPKALLILSGSFRTVRNSWNIGLFRNC